MEIGEHEKQFTIWNAASESLLSVAFGSKLTRPCQWRRVEDLRRGDSGIRGRCKVKADFVAGLLAQCYRSTFVVHSMEDHLRLGSRPLVAVSVTQASPPIENGQKEDSSHDTTR